jgi:hypothetical protein
MSATRAEIKILSFEDVKRIITEGKLHLLGRSESQQKIYDAFYDKILVSWSSVGDYVLVKKLGLPGEIDLTQPRKQRVSKPFPSHMKNVVKCLQNDFPYYFERKYFSERNYRKVIYNKPMFFFY